MTGRTMLMLASAVLAGSLLATDAAQARGGGGGGATAGLALAKNAHHSNGHNLLGEKIHKNGKHEVGKIGANSVIAEVSNDKVVGMSAGSLPVQKVKSNKKMAASGDTINVATSGTIRLAQLDAYSYGYCFDTGIDLYCYWYPSTDVVVTDPWAPYP